MRNLFTESVLKNERRVVTSTEEKRGPVRKRQDAGRDGIHCSAIAQGLPSAVASEDRISAAIDPWLTMAASEMPPVILLFRPAFLEIGSAVTRIHLNRPWKGLHVPPLIWAAEVNFDPGSVALVLASDVYNEADYVRDYDDYLALMKELTQKQV